MAEAMFELTTKDLKKLKRFYKNAPKQFRYASANVLNSEAFGSRLNSLAIIKSKMTVRREGFIKRQMNVVKANGREPVRSQRAIMGSLEKRGFSGWVEQETGQRTERARIATLEGRRGDEMKAVIPSARFMPGKDFLTVPDDINVRNATDEQHRTIVALSILRRKRYRKPFIIKSRGGSRLSLYKRKGQKLRKLQTYDKYQNRLQPARVKWLSGGVDRYFRETDLRKLWANAVQQQLKFRKGK